MTEVSIKAGDSLGYFAGLLEIHFKNVDALCAAQQKLFDGLGKWQAGFPGQFSWLSQRLLNNPLASSEAPDMRALMRHPIAVIKESIKVSQRNSALLTEILADSQVALQTRMAAALDELDTVISQAVPEISALSYARPPEQQTPPGA